MKKTLITLIVSLFLAGIAQAQVPAMPEDVLRAAQAGDTEAQVEMGILYEYGYHMKDNRISALAWYMKAAKRGNARATMYRDRLMKKLTPAEVDRARDLAASLKISAPAN